MEQNVVSGIAYARDEAKVTLLKIADKPGVAAQVFCPLADANINVDMIVQNVSEDGFTDLTFTVQSADFDRAIEVLRKSRDAIGYADLRGSSDIAKVSAIGVGMRSHAGVASQMFSALGRKRHQYRGDFDLGDQNQRIDRCGLRRACGADFAFLVRTGQPLGLTGRPPQAFHKLRFAAKPGGEDWTLCQFQLAPRDCCYAACAR